MITKIDLQNFRCFKSVSAGLSPLTVLIGKNDTGKSAFLDALMLLSAGPDRRLKLSEDIWHFQVKDLKLNMAAQFEEKKDNAILWNRVTSNKPYCNKNFQTNKSSLFNLPHTGPVMVSPGISESEGPPGLSSDGKGIPALLDFFLRKDRKRFFSFVDAAIAHIPGLTDIQIATPQPNLRRVDLVVDHDFVISADQSSVGVRLMLFFLALAYHPEPPELILIEEPERGVHPSRLSDIIQLFRGLTEGAQTPGASQVILTTHSPYLLDLIDIDRDGVLIFQREEDGSRTVHPADADRLKVFLDEFHLGEVWYNEGEAGMIRPAQKSKSKSLSVSRQVSGLSADYAD
jgi:AAA15 family ATPase/GTPase